VAVARARAAQQPASQPSAKSRSGGSRFVEPTHLDEEQKRRIDKAMTQRRIGDDMGRAIFIGALEYQLSAFGRQLVRRDALPPRPAPREDRAQTQAVQDIARQARQLVGLLQALPDATTAGLTVALAAQDRLSRAYDERYLRDLAAEIERLERACGAAGTAPVADPEPPPEDPAPSRPFVAKLAKVFEECFEMKPTADEDGPFRATLAVLDEITGLLIGHEPDFLADILSATPSR
jgi:hypothetical protein